MFHRLIALLEGESRTQIIDNMRTGQKPVWMGMDEWLNSGRLGYHITECHWYDPGWPMRTGCCHVMNHSHTSRLAVFLQKHAGKVVRQADAPLAAVCAEHPGTQERAESYLASRTYSTDTDSYRTAEGHSDIMTEQPNITTAQIHTAYHQAMLHLDDDKALLIPEVQSYMRAAIRALNALERVRRRAEALRDIQQAEATIQEAKRTLVMLADPVLEPEEEVIEDSRPEVNP